AAFAISSTATFALAAAFAEVAFLAHLIAAAVLAGGRPDGFGIALSFVLHRCFATQLDAALVIDGDDLHAHLIAHVHEIGHAIDVAVGQFADMHQAVRLRRDFDECAEILDADHAALIDLADLYLGGHRLDDV